nr:class I SAM-dependent methyltransferase [Sphingomonas hankyongi]
MWRCGGCGSGYLDPRPDERSIGRAYERYYTHEQQRPIADHSWIGRWRTKLGNGYRNALYGTQLRPSSKAGPILAALVPPLRWPADVAFRYLPRSKPGSRVLDIGCGNGDWLAFPKQAGWQVAGVEPDENARRAGSDRGFDIRPSLSDFSNEAFNALTLSHVIEHVHDPLSTLQTCHELLIPGATIFIDTPNLDSVGHRIYGKNWRGLEPPRHLVLFNREGLHRALEASGFVDIRFRRRFYPLSGMQLQSRLIASGIDPFSDAAPACRAPKFTASELLEATFSKKHTEFLTVTGRRAPS